MGAYYNEGKENIDWNFLLMISNNLGKPIHYKTDIKYYYAEGFANNSIV